MRPKLCHVLAGLLLGLPVTASWMLPQAVAQNRPAQPVIEDLQLNADSGLAAGSTLQVTVRGTPGGKARVQLPGSEAALELRETRRGVYTGSYAVRRGDRIDPTRLIRTSLSAGPRTTVANFSFPPAFVALAKPAPAARPRPPQPAVAAAPPPPPAPAPAAPALRIDRFSAGPVTRLDPGTELQFSLTGAPGALASFELPGIASGLPMREVRPGEYVGTYTLRRQDTLAAGPVVATLRAGERWVRTELSAPLLTDRTAPVIGGLVPRHGEATSGGTTQVAGTLDDAGGTGVDPRSVRLSIGGRDVTADAQVTAQSFSWRGSLPPGRHAVEVSARDRAGNAAQQSWNFDVGTAMGAASASVLPLQVLSPSPNSAIDGANVVIRGRTTPGAAVQVTVDAVAPRVSTRASVAQPVTQQTVVADINGNFSFDLGAYRAVMGTRYEVSMIASLGGQWAEQRLVLFQRPS